MESSKDISGVKKEPQDTWPDAGGDYDFDSVDSSEAKNIQMFPLYKSPANHTNESKLKRHIMAVTNCKL
ncbi:hypothetical protein TKK_0003310 [Trichogramma kaykai]